MKDACRLGLASVLGLTMTAGATVAGGQEMRVTPAPPPPPAIPDMAGQAPFTTDRLVRARQNLAGLLDGRVPVTALSAEELQDVIELDRALRAGNGQQMTPRQQCVDDEVRRAGGRPSRLAWEVIRLKCR